MENTITMHQLSRFPLQGNHAVLDCSSCHKSSSRLQYEPLGVECVDCHRKDYQATHSPDHQKLNYPTNCVECHGEKATGWTSSSFNHEAFPLTNGHNISCVECHTNGSYQKISNECVSCHQVQYTNAKGHVASNFPTDCTICHNSVNWLQSTFNHATTNFPLTGAHIPVDCVRCHATGYVGTSTACNSCHQTNYNQTTNPNHQTLGLSAICTDCHTTVPGWQPASFPIHNNYYPLTGGHAVVANDCAACHKGVSPNTTKVCYNCHTTNYNNTKNPAHKTAQFPTDCTICHSVNAWIPSTYNHDLQYFPIYSGKHQGRWTLCSECHTTASNYAVFSCIICHEHSNKASVDNDHSGVKGYSYTGTSCYTCHPQGRN